jgi:hypothetical protein
LLADGTGLLQLVELFEQREFWFVLKDHRVCGYVHYSDLNHSLVKFSFYVLFQALEQLVLDSVPGCNDPKFLSESLKDRFAQIEREFKKDGEAARTYSGYLSTRDLLRVATNAWLFEISEEIGKRMKDVRDDSSHANARLIESYAEVPFLADVQRKYLQILSASGGPKSA